MRAAQDIAYAARPDATAEAEVSAIANIYRFVLNRNAAGVTSTNGDDAKERSRHDSSAKTIIQKPN